MDMDQPVDQKMTPRTAVLTAAAIGALVSVGIGAYGAAHPPGQVAINVAGFSSFLSVKSWLATLALVLAIVQVVTALKIFGKIRGNS